ncbi:MAG TPA: TIM barrel protein [Cellulomonas sp.]
MSREPRFAANCTLLFTELPVNDRARAARDAGFDGVEFWWPFATATPDPGELDDFVGGVEASGLPLVGLNFFAGQLPGPDRGILSWPGREGEFAQNVAAIVEIAGRLGTRSFNALYGNAQEGVDEATWRDVALRNLATAAEAVAPLGGQVLLEAVSGSPSYPLKTGLDVATEIARVRARTGATNVSMLADVYHLTVNGDDYAAVLRTSPDLVGHVQYADFPGRHEPGTGDLDLGELLRVLAEIGYGAWVAFEYQPSGTTQDHLAWLAPPSTIASPDGDRS